MRTFVSAFNKKLDCLFIQEINAGKQETKPENIKTGFDFIYNRYASNKK